MIKTKFSHMLKKKTHHVFNKLYSFFLLPMITNVLNFYKATGLHFSTFYMFEDSEIHQKYVVCKKPNPV